MTQDVTIERTLDTSIERVWAMWTEAENFASWYGPMGATIPSAEMDVTVGGRRFIEMAMETPNGPMQMWFVGEYREIVDGERLVYTEMMSDEDGNEHSPETVVTVLLSDADDGTHMSLTHDGLAVSDHCSFLWCSCLGGG